MFLGQERDQHLVARHVKEDLIQRARRQKISVLGANP